jgi:hypothetical protein
MRVVACLEQSPLPAVGAQVAVGGCSCRGLRGWRSESPVGAGSRSAQRVLRTMRYLGFCQPGGAALRATRSVPATESRLAVRGQFHEHRHQTHPGEGVDHHRIRHQPIDQPVPAVSEAVTASPRAWALRTATRLRIRAKPAGVTTTDSSTRTISTVRTISPTWRPKRLTKP